MAEHLERAQGRLENVRSAEPILGALRTISLGAWQAALKQKRTTAEAAALLEGMLAGLAPQLPDAWLPRAETQPGGARVIALVIGSERGLCGRFNLGLRERAEDYLAGQAALGAQVELWVLGARLKRLFLPERVAWSGALPGRTPRPGLACSLIGAWLTRFESYALDRVDVLYNACRGGGRSAPAAQQVLPPRFELRPRQAESSTWPPPIVETDVRQLVARAAPHWLALRLHHCLLESACSEHAARAHLMEEATQNARRLIDELTSLTQLARRQAITREIQSLAVGAGLLDT